MINRLDELLHKITGEPYPFKDPEMNVLWLAYVKAMNEYTKKVKSPCNMEFMYKVIVEPKRKAYEDYQELTLKRTMTQNLNSVRQIEKATAIKTKNSRKRRY